MEFLVFQLHPALSSWGEPAVGEYRGTHVRPSQSALVGLLAAALGIKRDEEDRHSALTSGYAFAVGVQSDGHLLRDYQTAQVPGRAALRRRPHRTRKDELAMPARELETVLSTRDYRQGAASVIAVQSQEGAPYTLPTLMQALRQPRFTLYLGRKSCPLSAPLDPRIVSEESALKALHAYLATRKDDPIAAAPLRYLAWSEQVVAGVEPDLSVLRKDRIIRRKGWRFGDRTEHIKFLGEVF